MATNSLMTKMLKSASKDNKISMLSSSQFFDKDPIFNSSVPMINLMVSGEITGGIRPGVHLVCGDSRTFKCVDKDTKLIIYVTDDIKAKYFKQ